MESIGLKEWAIVCKALGRGRQSIIVRKGGLAEGRGGFSFRHREFFLFPTWFHEQPEKVRATDIKFPFATPGKIKIDFFARIDFVKTIHSWETAQALEPLHILKPEVVRERFEFEGAPGLHVALLRVFRVIPTWTIAEEKKYGGCRSWVNLPNPPADLRLETVLGDSEHGSLRDRFVRLFTRSGAAATASD